MPNAWLILPTYNEAENLEPMVRAVLPRLSQQGSTPTVLIVDDSSPDGTGQIADRLAAELAEVQVMHRSRKEGLGRAYLAGFAAALAGGADLILQMDCDFSHDPADLPRLMAASATRGRRARLALRARRRRGELGAAAADSEPRRVHLRAADPGRAGPRPDRRLQVLDAARRCRRSTSTASTRTDTPSRSR